MLSYYILKIYNWYVLKNIYLLPKENAGALPRFESGTVFPRLKFNFLKDKVKIIGNLSFYCITIQKKTKILIKINLKKYFYQIQVFEINKRINLK